jgi:hypothetical protein
MIVRLRAQLRRFGLCAAAFIYALLAGAPSQASKPCLDIARINSWEASEHGDSVLVRLGASSLYRLIFAPGSAAVSFKGLATLEFDRRDSRLCAGTDYLLADGRRLLIEKIEPIEKP